MSSLFHEVEVALADLALAELGPGLWDVVVGGLGLGYTARAALRHPAVRSVLVVEALAPVMEWHQQGLVPLGSELTSDPRCRLVQGDFFALSRSPDGFDPLQPKRTFHGVLLDIDHSPDHLLHPRHAEFYRVDGLQSLAGHLTEGGVFAQWSDDPPDEKFLEALGDVFSAAHARVVKFPNPLIDDGESASTVYLGRKPFAGIGQS